jgi:hypothetical protein
MAGDRRHADCRRLERATIESALSDFAGQPGRDVGLMIHIRHDDLPPLATRLTDTQAHKTNERCSIHAKRDLV